MSGNGENYDGHDPFAGRKVEFTVTPIPAPPMQVEVVRPEKDGHRIAVLFVSALILLPLKAGLVSLAAARIGFVPDLGFSESAWLVVGVSALKSGGDYLSWTKEKKS